MKYLTSYILIVLLSGIAGCATHPMLTDTEVSSRYPELGQLKSDLTLADQNDVDLLSPRLYRQANNQYTEALALARTGNESARKTAKQGATSLNQAITHSNSTRNELSQVIQARDRALSAGR